MPWQAWLGVSANHRVGCGHSKGSLVLRAKRSIKCHKGMCPMAAHCWTGSRPVGLLVGGASMANGPLVAAPGYGWQRISVDSHPQVHTGALSGRPAAEWCKRGHRLIWEQGRGDGQSRKLGLLLLVEEKRLRLQFGGENNCRLLLCISRGTKKSRGKERKHWGCSCWCGLVARVR
jgi:hypothetical protein